MVHAEHLGNEVHLAHVERSVHEHHVPRLDGRIVLDKEDLIRFSMEYSLYSKYWSGAVLTVCNVDSVVCNVVCMVAEVYWPYLDLCVFRNCCRYLVLLEFHIPNLSLTFRVNVCLCWIHCQMDCYDFYLQTE